LCDLCGESEIACKCFDEGKEPTYSDCNECGGEGKIDAAKAKGKKV
jgi:RecJ-like exonuclease